MRRKREMKTQLGTILQEQEWLDEEGDPLQASWPWPYRQMVYVKTRIYEKREREFAESIFYNGKQTFLKDTHTCI